MPWIVPMLSSGVGNCTSARNPVWQRGGAAGYVRKVPPIGDIAPPLQRETLFSAISLSTLKMPMAHRRRRQVCIRRRPPDWSMRVGTAGSMMAGHCVKVRRPADRRARRLGAGVSIPRVAVRADARWADRRCGRERRRARPWDRRR